MPSGLCKSCTELSGLSGNHSSLGFDLTFRSEYVTRACLFWISVMTPTYLDSRFMLLMVFTLVHGLSKDTSKSPLHVHLTRRILHGFSGACFSKVSHSRLSEHLELFTTQRICNATQSHNQVDCRKIAMEACQAWHAESLSYQAPPMPGMSVMTCTKKDQSLQREENDICCLACWHNKIHACRFHPSYFNHPILFQY